MQKLLKKEGICIIILLNLLLTAHRNSVFEITHYPPIRYEIHSFFTNKSLVHSHTGTYRSTKPKDCTWYLTLSLINYQKCEMCDISSMRLTTPVDRCPRKIHLLLTRKQVICKVLTATLSQTWTHISDNWLDWSRERFGQSNVQFTLQGIEYPN